MGLLVGLALAVATLGYVLYPFFAVRSSGSGAAPGTSARVSRDVTDEEIEAAIRSYRAREATGISCPVCGARPESDALYCSSCGRQLAVPDAAG